MIILLKLYKRSAHSSKILKTKYNKPNKYIKFKINIQHNNNPNKLI